MKRKDIETCEKVFERKQKVNDAEEKAKRKALEEIDMIQASDAKVALGTNRVIMLES